MARNVWGNRHEIAARRLRNILSSHGIANDRILEQKISDAGPGPQRVDPHILTEARIALMQRGTIVSRPGTGGMPWYHLAVTRPDIVDARFAELSAIHDAAQHLSALVGQTLEIAILRSLKSQAECDFMGDFPDLDDHDDSIQYSKEEPPASLSGRRIPGRRRLDFLLHRSDGGYAGVEAKNVRQWFYPDREEIRELLLKCCALDIVPVLIARRIHYSTFSVLNPCGVILHQTFNQLYPNSARALVPQLRDKDLLGFHDIRMIDAQDAAKTHARLDAFFQSSIPSVLPRARTAFDAYKDLLSAYANGEYGYTEFAGRVKRRYRGEPEDLPEFEPTDFGAPEEW